ncbi:hypothetical protein XPA_004595 [Xanthoria parietina]
MESLRLVCTDSSNLADGLLVTTLRFHPHPRDMRKLCFPPQRPKIAVAAAASAVKIHVTVWPFHSVSTSIGTSYMTTAACFRSVYAVSFKTATIKKPSTNPFHHKQRHVALIYATSPVPHVILRCRRSRTQF